MYDLILIDITSITLERSREIVARLKELLKEIPEIDIMSIQVTDRDMIIGDDQYDTRYEL